MRLSSRLAVAVFALVAVSTRAGSQPCRPTVAPIRGTQILTVVNFTFNYTPKDETGGRSAGRTYAFMQLDSLGEKDGNKFVEAEGVPPNLIFDFKINTDNQDRYTGSLDLIGWGWSHITSKYRYENAYSSPAVLIKDLVADVYTNFISTGWYDGRPECNAGGRKRSGSR